MPRVTPRTLFSVDEVNACVPRLALLLERLQGSARRLDEERRAAGAVGATTLEALVRTRPAARLLIEELDAAVEGITALGGELKDLELGLVDFPARLEPGGEVVCLCWQLGEPEVRFWHGAAEGFAGRRPLAGAPPAGWLQ